MEWIDIRCLLADICPCQVFWFFGRWWRCFTNTWMLEHKPQWHGVCVSLNCVVADALDRLMLLAFCNALNYQWLQLLPWTWVMSAFLPTSAPSASLVGSGLSVWLEWSLLASRACHWVRSRDRTVHKFVRERNALSRTNGFVLVFPCLDLLAVVARLILIIQLAVVLVLQSSKICNFRSSSDDMAVSVCLCLFTRQGATARCGLSTAILSVAFPWHTASAL